MKEIICHSQKELDAAVKIKDAIIIIKDTTEWVDVYGNANIQSVSDNATIQSVSGNATIQSVYGNATIQSVYGNATIKIFSPDITIESGCLFAVIIMIGCVCKIKKKTKTVTVIKNKKSKYDKKSFCHIYHANLIDKETIKLYKSVQPSDHTDFYTGKIKYEGEVTCPDFDKSTDRVCGGGLHLSPLPHLALSFNQGLLLECAVKLKDFVVCSDDITKVRCKKVTVLGEYKE
jgi:hypothetical protein